MLLRAKDPKRKQKALDPGETEQRFLTEAVAEKNRTGLPKVGATTMSEPRRILVLEDDPKHRNVIAFNLTHAGFSVTTAAEAVKALFLAKQDRFDLVITDYYLPDYPGTDFVRLLRGFDGYEHVPAILLTGRAEELDQERLRDELLILLLSKPCAMACLVDTVSKCLAIAHCAS